MRFVGWILSSVAFLAVLGGAAAFLALSYFSRDLPDYSQLAVYEPPITTRLHAADGRLMAEYAFENRLFVPIEAIPDQVIQAFVSAEDQNYYQHHGIDFVGIGRAIVTNLRNLGSDRRLVGASTITQQVAKNFLLTNDVSFERKIREQLLALRIERTFSKDQILELYLNQIYLGRGSYGVASAALNFFDKPLTELTLAETAYLAGLPKAPNNYHPVFRRDAAIARRGYVLQRMADDGVITTAEQREAGSQPLEVRGRSTTERVTADYFAEEVRRELQQIYGDDALYAGGLSVRTTVDPDLQEIAERVLRDGLIAYDRRHGWRGPIATFDNFDDWPRRLGEIARPAGSGAWQLAVVLEVDAGEALIGLSDRRRGRIALEDVIWARPWRPGQRLGPAVDAMTDVLALGDVILAEPLYDDAVADGVQQTGEADGGDGDRPAPLYGLRQIPAVQGAVVAMDPHTGRVRAVAGGYSFEMSEFNRATQAARQPGSAFKPFVYLAGLESGYTPSTVLLDSPLAIDQGAGLGLWRPSNYSEDFLGPTPMRTGIEKSRNLMTIRLLQQIGLEPVREVAQRFGIMDSMPLLYSMALGAGETTPLQLTTAYAMLVNGGLEVSPSFIDRIQDRTGETIYSRDQRPCPSCENVEWAGQETPEPPDTRKRIADPIPTYQMVSMLEGVVQRGTARRLAALGVPLAGKTGTTNDYFDAWFMGFTPDLAVGVFVGFDNPRTLGDRETGSSAAVPIFGAFMAEALEGEAVPPFRIPRGVSLVRIDHGTGLLAPPGQPGIWEAYRPGTEPTRVSRGVIADDPGTAAFGQPDSPAAGSGIGGLY
ncbi:MAG: penicillin-binding protein 1A [Inquilinaceae bacterium]